MPVRTRIAPSPTGHLHIGTARTALFNWIFARKNGGEFVLRIEDTDLERSDKKYEDNIIEGLKWLGLDWDGPIFRQSERLSSYKKYLNQLLNGGKAFWCFHTQEELDQEKKEQRDKKEAQRHICSHKKEKRSPKGEKGIIRLAVDENSTRIIHFDDEIKGVIEWREHLLGDFSLAKGLESPLYNFAVVADDIDMEISHVIRGDDHISNTPKQILIYEVIQEVGDKHITIPKFAHLPMILGPDKSKLSKRHGAISVIDYKKDYVPEAIVNFIAFLGYTYSKDIITKEEMAKEFDFKKVHGSGAIFDIKKLNWINSQYIKNFSAGKLMDLTGVPKISEEALPLITERLERLSNIHNFDFFWKEPEYDPKLLIWKNSDPEDVKTSLSESGEIIKHIQLKDKEALKLALDDLGKKMANRGLVYWPLRVAVSGKDKSPDPVDIIFAIGKEQTIKRIEGAVNKLNEKNNF